MAELPIPDGYAVPLVDQSTDLLPGKTMVALDARYAYDDTHQIYVSAVSGNDIFNSGKNAARPLKTFDAAFNAAAGKTAIINLAAREIFPISKEYDIDVNNLAIRGNMSRIDARGIAVGQTAFTTYGTLAPPQFQAWTVMDGIEIFGGFPTTYAESRENGKRGLFLDHNDVANDKSGPSHTQYSNIVIRGFETGVEYGNQVYCTTFNHFMIGNVGTAISVPNGIENSGERLHWAHGTISDSHRAVDANLGTAELTFFDVSFDFIRYVNFKTTGSKIKLSDCHVEYRHWENDSNLIEVSGNSGSFIMDGISIKASTLPSGETVLRQYVIHNTSPWRNMSGIYNSMMHNMETASGDMVGGTGRTKIEGEHNYGGTTSSYRSTSPANNMLANGSFDFPTSVSQFVDDWFPITDAGTVDTNSLVRTNYTVTRSSDYSQSGSFSMKATKTATQGSTAVYAVAVPVGAVAPIPHARLWYKNSVVKAGTVRISYEAALVRRSGAVNIAVKREALGGTQDIDLASANTATWLSRSLTSMYRMGAWATHFMIVIDMTNAPSGTIIYFDDFNIDMS